MILLKHNLLNYYSVNAFIAGSSTLNIFMNDDLYKDNILDIFLRIPYSITRSKFKSSYYPYKVFAKEKIRNLLNLNNYEEITTPSIDYILITNISHIIKNILTFEKNQVIIIYDCTIDELHNSLGLNISRLAITTDHNNF